MLVSKAAIAELTEGDRLGTFLRHSKVIDELKAAIAAKNGANSCDRSKAIVCKAATRESAILEDRDSPSSMSAPSRDINSTIGAPKCGSTEELIAVGLHSPISRKNSRLSLTVRKVDL